MNGQKRVALILSAEEYAELSAQAKLSSMPVATFIRVLALRQLRDATLPPLRNLWRICCAFRIRMARPPCGTAKPCPAVVLRCLP